MPDFLKIAVLGALFVLPIKPTLAKDQGAVTPAVFDCWEPERTFKRCATTGPDGRPRLKQSYLARLRYDRHGLASVMLFNETDKGKARWFYVRRGVVPVPVETMDNGPDYFEDGLARSRVGGKIGYIDRKLNLVIPAAYDGAYPFRDGVAVVCTACTLVFDSTVTEGGRSWYEGGQWGRIDRTGRVVSPFRPWEEGQALRVRLTGASYKFHPAKAVGYSWLSSSAKAEDPVRCGFSVDQERLWNTGSPACAGDDGLWVRAPSLPDQHQPLIFS